MNMTVPDQVVRLALDPSVRRAVQSLPQHQPIQSDDRFDELLGRLAQSERESTALSVTERSPASAAASNRLLITCRALSSSARK
jgi:hypothetical protein